MSGRHYSNTTKKKAKRLRLQRKTYSEITKQLGIPKSTLSGWFGERLGISFTLDRKAQLEHLARIRSLAAEAIREKFAEQRKAEDMKITASVKKEIRKFPKNDAIVCKSLLAMLYWAEGSKHGKVCGLKFANTDPALSKLYITLLRKCYNLDEAKFRIRLHLHYYHKAIQAKKFWSRTLKVPLSQFASVYIKKRSRKKRFRKNFMGICFINYLDSSVRKDILTLAYALQEKITE